MARALANVRPMAERRFADRQGRRWEVRVLSRAEWRFDPVEGNPGPARLITPPRYESDPFELSVEELQRALETGREPSQRRTQSPFLD